MFVFRPDLNTFRELVKHAMASGSFDGGDQGLLNTFYGSWATRDISRHLPFTYNMVASATYSYLPAYKHFGHNVKIVHFIGEFVVVYFCYVIIAQLIFRSFQTLAGKFRRCWQCTDREHGEAFPHPPQAVVADLQQLGAASAERECGDTGQWRVYNCGLDALCHDCLRVQGMRCLGAVTSADYMDTPPPPGPAPAPAQAAPDTRQAWECGSPDYMGTASFENILKKIDKTIQEKKTNEGK